MEVLNPKQFKDGMDLIVEIRFSLTMLEEYVGQTCLAEKCEFLQKTEDIEEICKEFLVIIKNNELNLDEISRLFVVAIMIYFTNATPENFECRLQLLMKTFQYVDTLKPEHIHIATKRIWFAFNAEDIQNVFNLLTISHLISLASETGRAIAICLVWILLCNITETIIEMCCFLEFSELSQMLNELDDEMLQMDENIRMVYILVQCLGFLINAIVFGKNDNFIKAGYGNYFTFTQNDLENLKKYAEHLTSLLKINVSGDNNYELKITITEYINVNMIGILQEKISEMQSV